MTLDAADADATYFRVRLQHWWMSGRRDFPWRHSAGPYRILVAEMMLRRTRARQVAAVYTAFVERFPSPAVLAAASEASVQEALRPLGLTWRVPAFRQMARQLVERHGGNVPRDREALLALSGVGDYVADAVRGFAFGEPGAVVDTNTVRVAGRYFGFPVHAESRRRVAVRRAVQDLVDPSSPGEGNWALLDFAALVCRATTPLHDRCPVASRCTWWREAQEARRKGDIQDGEAG